MDREKLREAKVAFYVALLGMDSEDLTEVECEIAVKLSSELDADFVKQAVSEVRRRSSPIDRETLGKIKASFYAALVETDADLTSAEREIRDMLSTDPIGIG